MSEIARMERAADWLQRLSAPSSDEKLLEEWLEWCRTAPENLEAFEKLQQVWQAFDLPEFREVPVPPQRAHRRGLWMSALAASVLGLAIAGGWQLASRQEGQVQTLTTAVAEQGSQLLADGSRVDMGARTRIVTRYTGTARSVALEEGEAYFDVIREVRRPFVVTAGGLRITAVGTAFNVRRSGDRTTIVVSEGTVHIAPGSAGRNGHEVHAAIGEQVTFIESSSTILLSRIDPALATSWRSGVLKFVDEPLGSVVSSVNRYSARPIQIADPALANETFTGTVHAARTEEWLRALEYVLPVEVVDDRLGPVRLERR